jgi:LPXTG-motif cell wall-anchored protein
MNRAERRNQSRPKSSARKTGITYLTVAGVIGGTIGLASPAFAATSVDCDDLASDLTSLTTTGGTLTIAFTDPDPVTCDLAEGYIFQQPTAIVGPTNGTLGVQFSGETTIIGFDGLANLEISNINFTQSVGPTFLYFIRSYNDKVLLVSNSTFSDPDDAPGVDVSSAIYAEGSLQVTDSAFTNLTSSGVGAAISVNESSNGTTSITNSSFEGNVSTGPGGAVYTNNGTFVTNSNFKSNATVDSGGAIFSTGAEFLTIEGSTFESNLAGDGGAIYGGGEPAGGGTKMAGANLYVNNSTFVENSAPNAAAISLSEGSVIRNSTFWNNKASVATSGTIDHSVADLFGNILANDDASRVIGDGGSAGDLGANLFTDSSFVVDATRPGDGASELVSVTDLDIGLGTPNLNSTNPENSGTTKTIEIGADSVARDFYGATSTGIAQPAPDPSPAYNYSSTDQRGVFRPQGSGYDVGAYEIGETPDTEPSGEPELTDTEALADTGLETETNFLGLVGLGLAAILSGSVGLLRRRKKA